MSISDISVVLEGVEFRRDGAFETVRVVDRLELKAPRYLRVHSQNDARLKAKIKLEPGCELDVDLSNAISWGDLTGQMTCRLTFDKQSPDWIAKIGPVDFKFREVGQLPSPAE